MSFFDKINNYLIVNAIKEILKGWDPATYRDKPHSTKVAHTDSGAVGPGFKSQLRCCRVTVLGKLFTPIVPLFTKQQNCRVAGVTAGLAENNGSLPPGLWFTSPAGRLPRTGISSGTPRLVIEYGLPLLPVLTFAVVNLDVRCHHSQRRLQHFVFQQFDAGAVGVNPKRDLRPRGANVALGVGRVEATWNQQLLASVGVSVQIYLRHTDTDTQI